MDAAEFASVWSVTAPNGPKLAAWREHREWNLDDLAEHSGLDVAHIRELEAGTRPMDLATLAALVFAYDVPPMALRFGPGTWEADIAQVQSALHSLRWTLDRKDGGAKLAENIAEYVASHGADDVELWMHNAEDVQRFISHLLDALENATPADTDDD